MNTEREQMLDSLLRIELSAQEIDDEMEVKKEAYAKELDDKIKAYDDELAKTKETRLAEIRTQIENEKNECLKKMREETLAGITRIDEAFEKNHSIWAQEIFEQIVKE